MCLLSTYVSMCLSFIYHQSVFHLSLSSIYIYHLSIHPSIYHLSSLYKFFSSKQSLYLLCHVLMPLEIYTSEFFIAQQLWLYFYFLFEQSEISLISQFLIYPLRNVAAFVIKILNVSSKPSSRTIIPHSLPMVNQG